MEIVYSPTARKQFKKLPKASQIKVLKNIRKIAADPWVGKRLKGKLEGLWTARAWPYRIIYRFSGKLLMIVIVQHRQQAYK